VTLGVRGKLFVAVLGVVSLAMSASGLVLARALDALMLDHMSQDLQARATLVADEVQRTSREAWPGLARRLSARSQARVTLLDEAGQVLADSGVQDADVATMENHGQRPEVEEASRGGHGWSVRQSHTLNARMLYAAVGLHPGGVVRLAVSLDAWDATLRRTHVLLGLAVLLGLVLSVLATAMAARLMSRSVLRLTSLARELANGNLDQRVHTQGTDEVAELGRALNGLAENLSRTLQELRVERDLLGRILEDMREGVVVLDGDGRAVMLNVALKDMLLLDGAVVGRPILQVLNNADITGLVDKARATGGPQTGEAEVVGLTPRRVLVSVAPLSGAPGSLLLVLVDVTELRRLENVRKDFVANVSHELRTPVMAVRSATETLMSGARQDPQATARFLDIIERNAERLANLVEDLLELSRIESRRMTLDLMPTDVARVIQGILPLFRDRAERRNIRLEVALPPDLPEVMADARALEKVLSNLVDNATKYSGEGSEVRVVAQQRGEEVVLSVEDTGPGIEARHLTRVFERFYRVDAGRSRELGGTGLGLAIVKHLVEAMEGSVRVESQVGKGSTFQVTIRTAAADVEDHG
jgi:two-component system phosphate regulon sensor histidine kinase PhoR